MAEAMESEGSRNELSLKKSTVQQHVASSKHKFGKEKLAKKEKREINIAQALKISLSCTSPWRTVHNYVRIYHKRF